MNIQSLITNKHTSGSAAAYAAVKVGSLIARAWFPQYERQISVTAEALEGFAVLYLGASAGDAMQSQREVQDLRERTAQAVVTHDTSILTKQ
jgi:hypothetical protein